MQGNGPQLDLNGSVLPPSSNPAPVNPYLLELASDTNATQYVVAKVLPSILPSQVMVTITGHTISGTLLISGTGITFASWNSIMQSAFVNGLASDVVPTPDMCFVSNAQDASLAVSWINIGNAVPNSLPQGILVTYNVDGYACPPVLNATNPCLDAGYSVASSDQMVLNALNAQSQTGQAVLGALGPGTWNGYTITDVSPCIQIGLTSSCNNGDGEPLIAVTVGVGIDIITSPNTSSTGTNAGAGSSGSLASDLVEALFDSALNSGIISAALTAAHIGSASPPSNVQTARAVRASNAGVCVATTTNDAASAAAIAAAAAATSAANEKVYLAVMVAFIAAFGTSILAFFAGIYITKNKAPRYASATPPGKIPTFEATGQEAYLEQRAASGRLAAQNSLKTYA
jgi:hypothetical protein